ncbi:uncharacterized mitochondrial protein-like protein [Tanacetum coccineum]
MKKMYCLVFKDDYSRFTLVFFLATKDETSGILNVARTPQQNGVAERRNRTLIEAARTMLADSKLPTSFWAEAVNTACYADEGFFVGYSLNSKAFRVFNIRTRLVEENLHIRFSESTPNAVGSGPDSLFDIDALTRTMNYEPIVAGTQSNGFAGTKASDNAGQARKETEPKEDNVNNTNNVNASGINKVNVVGGKTSIELAFDPNMHALKDYSIFHFLRDDENDSAVADINYLDITIQVSPIPTIRIHKDHPLDQVIGDLQSAIQTRKMSKNLEEHGFVSTINKEQTIKTFKTACVLAFYHRNNLKSNHALDKIGNLSQKELCIAFEKLMHEKFQMSSMGELTFFLGLQVKQKKDGIFISQDKYVDEILKKFGFTKVKTASTPMETQKPLLKDEDGKEVDVHMYRSMIGSLMYLTSSRPDIMFVVCACARYQVNPKVSHLHAMKRIFRYLKGQPKLGLWYPKDSPFDLVAYTDSDYAGASLDRKSTTGGCQFLRCRLISWQCKKQTVVANSTTEAEYVAASSCCGQNGIGVNAGDSKLMLLGITYYCWVKVNAVEDLQLADEESVDCLSNSTIFEQLTLMRKPKRKDTQVPQPSDPIENVADEAVHKELGNSLVRTATTASSLEAKQDSGNINKTQSKATPNESSSLGTTSGGGPRVLDLEKTKTTQHNEIVSLKRRVKKLEKKNRSRTLKLIRLYKVSLTARVESSDNEESLDGEEVFVAEQEVVVKDVNNVVSTVGDATTVSAATTTTAAITIVDDINLAQDKGKGILIEPVKPMKKKDLIRLDEEVALKLQAEFDEEERLAREKAEKEKEANIALIETWDDIQAQEQEELSIKEKATLFQQLLEKRRKHFAAKRAEEKRNKPPTKAQQRKIIAFKRVNTFEDFRTELVEGKEKRAGTELIQENAKKQKVEDDKETAELKQCLEIIPDEEEERIVGIKSLLDAVRITATHVCVNAAQLEFVLLRDFKENTLSVYYC